MTTSSNKRRPSITDILAIWASSKSLGDCYEVFLASARLLQCAQHVYIDEWKSVNISADSIEKIIDIICLPKESLKDALISTEIRREAISLLRRIVMDGMKPCNINHLNRLNIQSVVNKKAPLLISTVLEFGLSDSKYYANAFDVLVHIIPILTNGFHDLVAYELSKDISSATECLSLISFISDFVEIDAKRCFYIERYVHTFQKLLTTKFDSVTRNKLVLSVVHLLQVFLSQESAPQSKQAWIKIFPSLVSDLIRNPFATMDEALRRSMFKYLSLSASHDSICRHVRSIATRQNFLDWIQKSQDHLKITIEQTNGNLGIYDSQSVSMQPSVTIESIIFRMEYEFELYALLYLSDYNYPVDHRVSSTPFPRSIECPDESPYDETYIAIVVRVLRDSMIYIRRRCNNPWSSVWANISNVLSTMTRFVDFAMIPSIQNDLLSISDEVTESVLYLFKSSILETPSTSSTNSPKPTSRGNSPHSKNNAESPSIVNNSKSLKSIRKSALRRRLKNGNYQHPFKVPNDHGIKSIDERSSVTDNQPASHFSNPLEYDRLKLQALFHLMTILNAICGFQSLCWTVPSHLVPYDLMKDALLIDPSAAAVLLQDPDDATKMTRARSRSNHMNRSSVSIADIEQLSSKLPPKRSNHSSAVLNRVHDRLLEFDLEMISALSPGWFIEDVGFSNMSSDSTKESSFVNGSKTDMSRSSISIGMQRDAIITMDEKLDIDSFTEDFSSEAKTETISWKLVYMLIIIRHIGLWRLVVADCQTAHGLDLSNMVEFIAGLLKKSFSIHLQLHLKESTIVFYDRYYQTMIRTCLEIICVLFQFNQPINQSQRSVNHLSGGQSSSDHSTYDLPPANVTTETATFLYEFCINTISLIFQHNRSKLISHRNFITHPYPDAVEYDSIPNPLVIDHDHLIDVEECNATGIVFDCMSVLIALASQSTQNNARREIIRNYTIISVVITYMDPFQPSIPLLLLLNACMDRIPKLPDSSEEQLLNLLLTSLRCGDKSIQILACDVIANISQVHPGLIYRIIGRPEIEDQLLFLLLSHKKYHSYESFYRQINRNVFDKKHFSSHVTEKQSIGVNASKRDDNASIAEVKKQYFKDMRQANCELYLSQLCTILRACSACVKDINPRPTWINLPGENYYPWRIYINGLPSRHLLHESIIYIVIQKVVAIMSTSRSDSSGQSRTSSASGLDMQSPMSGESDQSSIITAAISNYSVESIAELSLVNEPSEGSTITTAQSPLIVLAFAELLSFATALMYNCAEGVLATIQHQAQSRLSSIEKLRASDGAVIASGYHHLILKDELVGNIVPLLPRALDLITMRESVAAHLSKSTNNSPIQSSSSIPSYPPKGKTHRSLEKPVDDANYHSQYSTTPAGNNVSNERSNDHNLHARSTIDLIDGAKVIHVNNIVYEESIERTRSHSLDDSALVDKNVRGPKKISVINGAAVKVLDLSVIEGDDGLIDPRLQRSYSAVGVSPRSSADAKVDLPPAREIEKRNSFKFVDGVKQITKVFNRSPMKTSSKPTDTNGQAESRDVHRISPHPSQRRSNQRLNDETFQNATAFPDLSYPDSRFNTGTQVISLESTLSSSATTTLPVNKALALLSSRTLDAVFAFLCLDEMFPMSTYLRNVIIFSHIPVIACVCYLMIRYYSNEFIQKRGLLILKTFAFNHIEATSLSIHCPLALLACFKLLGSQDVEVQINCSRVISVIASFDENCRENLLRYNVFQEILAYIMQESDNIDALVACCSAISSLSHTERNVYMLTMGGRCSIHDKLFALLKKYPNEQRIQVEALRALISLADHSIDVSKRIMNVNHSAGSSQEDDIHAFYAATLKKTCRFLHDVMRQEELLPEYTKQEIMGLVNSSIAHKLTDSCVVS